MELYCNM